MAAAAITRMGRRQRGGAAAAVTAELDGRLGGASGGLTARQPRRDEHGTRVAARTVAMQVASAGGVKASGERRPSRIGGTHRRIPRLPPPPSTVHEERARGVVTVPCFSSRIFFV